MLRIIFIHVFLVCLSTLNGQDISVYTEENDKITKLLAKNTSEKITYSVSITLNVKGYKVTQAPPYEVTLKPGEAKEVVSLIEKPGEKISFEYQVSYKTVGGQQQADLSNLKVLPKDTIYVFSGNQCSKSGMVIKRLRESDKIYKELSLTNPENYELLKGVLAAEIKPGKQFTFYTPVVVVNGIPLSDPKRVDEWIQKLNAKQ